MNKSTSINIYEGNDPTCLSTGTTLCSALTRIVLKFPVSSCFHSESLIEQTIEVLATNATFFSIQMIEPQKSSALIILTCAFEMDKKGNKTNHRCFGYLNSLSHTHAYLWNGPYLSPPLAFQPITHPPNHQLLAIFIVSATISLNTAVASNPIRPLIRPQ